MGQGNGIEEPFRSPRVYTVEVARGKDKGASSEALLALALLSVTVLLAASYIEKELPALARIACRCAAVVLG